MGVRRLLSLLVSIKDGTRPINVLDEIRKSGEKEPLVVIDLLTMISPLSGAAGDHIFGCRNQFALPKATKFCDALIKAGARLVFFIDGKLQEDKYDTWLKRQDEIYMSSLRQLNRAQRSRCVVKGNVTKQAFVNALIAAAREKCDLITTYDFECDKEVAAFCKKNNAYAVFTGDSDYLIYEGNWRIWCSFELSPSTMCTREWNKEVLRQALGLQWNQMPFFAVIAGNDRFSHRPCDMELYEVARLVRKLDLKLGETEITTELCEQIFGTKDENLKNAFQDCVGFYDQKCTVETPLVPPYMRDYPNYAISILQKFPGTIRLPCLDLREMNYSKIALQIYLRQIGVLLRERALTGNEDLTSRIFMKPDHYTPYTIVTVSPIYPPYTVPSPQDLYSRDKETCANLYSTKLKLLCWIVSEKLNSDEIGKIHLTYLLDVLTLYFLVQNKIVDVPSADILLVAIHHCVEDKIPSYLPRFYPQKSNLRIGQCYFHFYTQFYFCAEIVGLLEHLNTHFLHKFDGVYFHQIIHQYKNDRQTVRSMLEKIAHWRIYADEN